MNRNIIKLAIALVVAILVYSVFWFFKVGQVEKKISAFISDNSAFVSASDISVSGFPFSQKITIKDLKFSIPNSPLSQYSILVKTIEANTGIFSSDFSTTIAMDAVSLKDSNDKALIVEFNQAPKIDFLLSDEGFARITYQDSGYKVLDSDKNTVLSTSNSLVTFVSSASEDGKIINRVNANVKDIAGFDVVDFYKNSLENKIINGLKTGEINVNSSTTTAAAPTPAPAPTSTTAAPVPSAANGLVNQADAAVNAAIAATNNVAANANLKPEIQAEVKAAITQAVAATTQAAAPATDSATPAAPAATVAAVATDVNASGEAPKSDSNQAANQIKSNLLLNLEFFASDSQAPISVPLDPTKIPEVAPAASQGKTIKINNLEFSNDIYKLYINGELNSFQDDNSLSGSISIKIEKFSSLVSSLIEGLKGILENQKTAVVATSTPDLNAAPDAVNVDKKEDPYQVFLMKLIANLDPISKELAAKNPVSKEDVSVFDVRREKNLEFLVNETSIREILGKL